ncbi:sugar phosphate isomerase/epimerase family protein [Mycobacterium vicinigordonae]|nr:sugar phosphate isomerase/epimerase family protein [Mycobacterium vicinigordonae]
MDRLAVGFLSVFGLPPVEFVDLAADLGCRHISLFLRGLPLASLGYPRFSLAHDAALRRNLRAALQHRGVTITLGDGFLVLPDSDVASLAIDLDVLAELGAPCINVVSLDPDRARTFDQFAELAGFAAQRSLRTLVEPVPSLTIGDLPTAVAAVRHVGRSDFQLLIDAMHLIRSGSTPGDLAAVDPDYVGYAQINDTTLQPRLPNYMEEAMFERMVPGDGELPLPQILAALPPGLVVEVEVPQRSLALAGISPFDRLAPCIEATRRLLSQSKTG